MSAAFAAAPTNSRRRTVDRGRRASKVVASTRTPPPNPRRPSGAWPTRSNGNDPRATARRTGCPFRRTSNMTTEPWPTAGSAPRRMAVSTQASRGRPSIAITTSPASNGLRTVVGATSTPTSVHDQLSLGITADSEGPASRVARASTATRRAMPPTTRVRIQPESREWMRTLRSSDAGDGSSQDRRAPS